MQNIAIEYWMVDLKNYALPLYSIELFLLLENLQKDLYPFLSAGFIWSKFMLIRNNYRVICPLMVIRCNVFLRFSVKQGITALISKIGLTISLHFSLSLCVQTIHRHFTLYVWLFLILPKRPVLLPPPNTESFGKIRQQHLPEHNNSPCILTLFYHTLYPTFWQPQSLIIYRLV